MFVAVVQKNNLKGGGGWSKCTIYTPAFTFFKTRVVAPSFPSTSSFSSFPSTSFFSFLSFYILFSFLSVYTRFFLVDTCTLRPMVFPRTTLERHGVYPSFLPSFLLYTRSLLTMRPSPTYVLLRPPPHQSVSVCLPVNWSMRTPCYPAICSIFICLFTHWLISQFLCSSYLLHYRKFFNCSVLYVHHIK